MRLNKETRQDIHNYIVLILRKDWEGADKWYISEDVLIREMYKRFHTEYSYYIKQVGERKALIEWLQGGALNFLHFWNDEIILLAEKWQQDISTEKKKDKLCEQWFSFIANQYQKLFRKHIK